MVEFEPIGELKIGHLAVLRDSRTNRYAIGYYDPKVRGTDEEYFGQDGEDLDISPTHFSYLE